MSIVTDIPEYTNNSKEWPNLGTSGKRVALPSKIERIGIRAFYDVQRFPTTLDLRKYPNLMYIGSKAFDNINSTKIQVREAVNYQVDSFKEGVTLEATWT